MADGGFARVAAGVLGRGSCVGAAADAAPLGPAGPPARVLLNPPDCRVLDGSQHAIQWRWSAHGLEVEHEGAACVSAVVAGAAELVVAGEGERMGRDSFVFLHEGERARLEIRAAEPVCVLTVLFRRGYLQSLDTGGGEAMVPVGAQDGTRVVGVPRRDPVVGGLLADLHLAVAVVPPEDRVLDQQIETLARALRRLDRVGERGTRCGLTRRPSTWRELERRMARARDFIDQHLADTLTLERIAREVYVSPFHFHRAFVDVCGETPHAYVRRRRLERARELLLTTRRSAMAVALAVGFATPSAFGAAFRHHFGCTPGAVRRHRDRAAVC